MKAITEIQFETGSRGPVSPDSKTDWRKRLQAGFLAGSLAVISVFYGITYDSLAEEKADDNAVLSEENTPLVAGHHPREMTYIKRKWGVEVMYVRESAAGYMLEFRYKVLDAEKAKPLFDRQTKPVLIDSETGARLVVPTPPTTGSLRNSNQPVTGKAYWMFFANPGTLIKPGRHVSIEIGEFRVDDLVVQ